MSKISAVASRLTQLRTERVVNWATGNYKGYKNASKEFAKLALTDMDAMNEMPQMNKFSVPLFSKTGFNIAKIWFMDKFRIKTAEEKELNRLLREKEIRRKLFYEE